MIDIDKWEGLTRDKLVADTLIINLNSRGHWERIESTIAEIIRTRGIQITSRDIYTLISDFIKRTLSELPANHLKIYTNVTWVNREWKVSYVINSRTVDGRGSILTSKALQDALESVSSRLLGELLYHIKLYSGDLSEALSKQDMDTVVMLINNTVAHLMGEDRTEDRFNVIVRDGMIYVTLHGKVYHFKPMKNPLGLNFTAEKIVEKVLGKGIVSQISKWEM